MSWRKEKEAAEKHCKTCLMSLCLAQDRKREVVDPHTALQSSGVYEIVVKIVLVIETEEIQDYSFSPN